MTRRVGWLAACLTVAACGAGTPEPRRTGAPPSTRIAPVADTVHGVQVIDNYRWLEDSSAEVSAWTDAQNSYTRSVLDGIADRGRVEARLTSLLRLGSATPPVMRGNRYFFARRAGSRTHPVLYARDGALGADRELLDPLEIDPAGRTAVAWFVPSEDGRVVAYGLARDGAPVATLRLLDIDGAAAVSTRPLEIPNVVQDPQWLADGTGLLYHSLRDPADPFSRQGAFHRIGTKPASDAVLYRNVRQPAQTTPGGGPSGSLSRDGRWIVLSYWRTPDTNDLWIAPFDEFLRKGSAAARVVSVGAPGQATGTIIGDTLYLHTTKGAPRGRVMAVGVAQPEQRRWRTIVDEHDDASIQSVAFARDSIAITYMRSAATTIDVFDRTGRPRGAIAQPGRGAASLSTEEDRTEAYLAFTSFTHPQTVYRVDLANPAAAPRHWGGPDTPVDSAFAEVSLVTYPSKDGTPVTMFVVQRKGQPRDGRAPTLITAHGAFNVSMSPMFWAPFYQLVEDGGVLAVPQVRGGGEHGEAWHSAGARDRKRNTVDDLVAAAEWLVANRYAGTRTLGVHGITNGGLAAAAAVIERPDLFRAALLIRPLVDLLRHQTFAPAPYWAEEYGSAADPIQFGWLRAISPYQRVKPGTAYPALLVTGALEDPEMPAAHARKAAAAWQAASTSDRSQQPVLLRIDRPSDDLAGLFALELRDVVDQVIFLRWQLTSS